MRKTSKQSTSTTLSRADFEKICTVEGIHINKKLLELLQTFLDDGLNHDECRQKILHYFKSKNEI